MATSGSEMNPTGVVTNEETRQKLFIAAEPLFPRVSVINPALMRSVTKDYLVYSAADIIAHSIEGYFTASVQPHFPSRIVESVINAVIETTEILLENPENDDVRGEFAWAATMALNGMTLTGTSGYSYPNHMIEHSLSALYNVPHGAGLSVVMPAWMKWYSPKNPGQFERFAKKIFGLSTPEERFAGHCRKRSGECAGVRSCRGLYRRDRHPHSGKRLVTRWREGDRRAVRLSRTIGNV